MTRKLEKDVRSIAHFENAFASLAEEPSGWRAASRRRALDHFVELGLPTRRQEEWRYTNVARIAKLAPLPALPDVASRVEAAPAIPDGAESRLVFVDGHLRDDLSTLETCTGATLRNLASSSEPVPGFGELAEIKDEAFSALNTAFAEDGAVIQLAANTVLEAPLHLIFIATANDNEPCASFPRVWIDAGTNAQAFIVQEHLTIGRDGRESNAAHFTNAVNEMRLGENANLRMLLVQRESPTAIHVARQVVRAARNARFGLHTLNLGGALVRNDLEVTLADEGAECDLFGLDLGSADQLHDNHTRVDHAMPNCRSHEFYKSVLGGNARSVFRGRVVVRPGAQHTDAEQQNRSILLSKRAEVDAKPQLEIYADDVRCSHGSSIGQLDPEALFFLRARGLEPDRARMLLVQGFANEIVEALPAGSPRDRVREQVSARLPRLLDTEGSDG